MDKFTLDKCPTCGKYTALKNGVCVECAKKLDLPDFFKDLFKGVK